VGNHGGILSENSAWNIETRLGINPWRNGWIGSHRVDHSNLPTSSQGVSGRDIRLFFGEADAALETFEFLHQALFQVGVAFFLAAGAMVVVGLAKLEEINDIESLQTDPVTGFCTATTADKLVEFLPTTPITTSIEELPKIDLLAEIQMGKEERAAKALLLRSRVMEIYDDLPPTFLVEDFVSRAFATNLLELVELSPLTWVYLIPALALANSIDLSHEVVNAASPNAAASAGYFFSTPSAIIPSTISVVVSLIWGLVNCLKMTEIKYMMMPRILVANNRSASYDGGQYQIASPPVDSPSMRETYLRSSISSLEWFSAIESLWAKPATSKYDELFGVAGGNGFDLYRNSIQKQTWLCITQIVFFGTQIVPRDLSAWLTQNPAVGDPDHLIPEIVCYGSFVALSVLQLIYLSPRSFWNFCLASSLKEDEESDELMDQCRMIY
jgi:hypothetical protein